MPRILSLNVTNGGTRIREPLLQRLGELEPDLVTLQETRCDTVGTWRQALVERGYDVFDTFELARRLGTQHPGPFRADGLLIACRWPITLIDPLEPGLPWPERLLSVTVHHPARPFELHTAHVPNASTGINLYRKGQHAAGRERMMKKTETFEGIHRAVTARPGMPRILTGDFNTPRAEHPDGRIDYWHDSCPSDLRAELGRRWWAAERSVIEGLREHGMRDVFRALHPAANGAFSWEHGSSKNRYRYDHVFASDVFEAQACEYLHEFRVTSSHHAGILADLRIE